MTQVDAQMSDLYQRLASVGLTESFVKQQGLPDWWSDEYEQCESALGTAIAHISKRFNLDLRSLLDPKMQPQLVLPQQPKYKIQNGTDLQQLPLPSAIAAKVADVVTFACDKPYLPIAGMSVSAIRQEILTRHSFIDLTGLLEFCWSRGIPVIHFTKYPKGISLFQGMTACFSQRPVIVLSLNAVSPSQLLFIAAHELGHILSNHLDLSGEDLLVDDEVQLESKDDQEIAANEIATELLLGRSDRFYGQLRNYTAEQLAEYADRVGRQDSVSPGVVVLNYGWYKKHWETANQALEILEPNANAPQQINNYLLENLNWDGLSQDYQDYLEMVLDLERG